MDLNIFTVLGILFIVGSTVGLLIVSAKYGIRATLDTYKGRDKKRVLERIEARKGVIGAEHTTELVEQFSMFAGASKTSSLKVTTGKLSQDVFTDSSQVDSLLNTLMKNDVTTTTNLKVEEPDFTQEDAESTGVLLVEGGEVESVTEVVSQVRTAVSLDNGQKGVFHLDTLYHNIEL